MASCLILNRCLESPKHIMNSYLLMNLSDLKRAFPQHFKVVRNFVNGMLFTDYVSAIWTVESSNLSIFKAHNSELTVESKDVYIVSCIIMAYTILSMNHPQPKKMNISLTCLAYSVDNLLDELEFKGYCLNDTDSKGVRQIVLQANDGFLSINALVGNLDFMCTHIAYGESCHLRSKPKPLQNPLTLLQISAKSLFKEQDLEDLEFGVISLPEHCLSVYVICNRKELSRFSTIIFNRAKPEKDKKNYFSSFCTLNSLLQKIESSVQCSVLSTDLDKHSKKCKEFDLLEGRSNVINEVHNSIIVITVGKHALVATAKVLFELEVKDVIEEPLKRAVTSLDSIELEITNMLHYSNDSCNHKMSQNCHHQRCYLKCENKLYSLNIFIKNSVLAYYIRRYLLLTMYSET